MLSSRSMAVPGSPSDDSRPTKLGRIEDDYHSHTNADESEIMQTPTKYKYQQFQWIDEIRLLKLHGENNGPELTAELVHVRLGDFPAYEAVSYTWADSRGDVSLSREITILPGRWRLRITKNCKCALWRFREHAIERTLWVDSICIYLRELRSRLGLMYNKIRRDV